MSPCVEDYCKKIVDAKVMGLKEDVARLKCKLLDERAKYEVIANEQAINTKKAMADQEASLKDSFNREKAIAIQETQYLTREAITRANKALA